MRGLLPILLVCLAAPLAPAAGTPNVLFIAVDDLRPELGMYGRGAKTPHLDAFAATALRFDRAYCNQAVCGASRVSLMTGLYPEYTGERSYHVTDWRRRWADVVTLNQHFQANGYTTVGLGKIYHGTAGPGVDRDHWTEWVEVNTGDQYANPDSLEKMRTTTRGKTKRTRGPSTESGRAPDDRYADGRRAAEGTRQLQKLAKTGRPFFLAVGFTKPHLPFIAPEKYWNLYQRESFSLPDNLGFPPGYPEWARNKGAGELRSYSDIPPEAPPTEFPPALNQRLIHGYHACVSYMDHPAAPHREIAYSSYPASPGKGAESTVGHSIRTPSHRYTEWWEKGTDRVVAKVVTNLEDDPGETTNALPEEKGLSAALSAKLKARVLAVRK